MLHFESGVGMSNPMAHPEVEAAWRADAFELGAALPGDALNAVGGSTNEPKQATFRWLGDETQTRRLREEQTHHYVPRSLPRSSGHRSGLDIHALTQR